MRLERIVESLGTFGLAHVVLRTGTDGALLVLPEYGRVLGLWTGLRGDSVLRINPRFLERLAIGAKEDVWTEPGGERVWLAPREEYFAGGDEVPPAMDPGRYAGRADGAGYAMENRGDLYAWTTGTAVRFRLIRRVVPLEDAEVEKRWGATWLRRAGYVEECSLHGDRRSPPGTRLWSLAQVPPGAGAERLLRGHGGAASGILCVVPGEKGHAQLVVKAAEPGAETEPADAGAEFSLAAGDACREVSCLSPPAAGRPRLVWRTSLCMFSGRTEEVETLAARLAG